MQSTHPWLYIDPLLLSWFLIRHSFFFLQRKSGLACMQVGHDNQVCCYLCNNSVIVWSRLNITCLSEQIAIFCNGEKCSNKTTVRIMLCTCGSSSLHCSKHQSRCCLVCFYLLFSGSCSRYSPIYFDLFTIPAISSKLSKPLGGPWTVFGLEAVLPTASSFPCPQSYW